MSVGSQVCITASRSFKWLFWLLI